MRRVAGWYEYWLADGSGITREQRERQWAASALGAAVAAPCNPVSGSLAFVKRQRYSVLIMLETAPGRAHAALHHDVAHGLRALAAAGRDAELELKLVERIDTVRDRGTDLSVRNRLADTDNHGRRHS
ncbi:conserved protein of unknown function [Paraburkholderia dioscoreae]|uniref:Uncharacterized protein n=1 Tax=Paraburkholderia dioscoreae TaxID=2604047 RepID=A0A5Q4ZAJ1_9BURK|nr:conserved protein of unknown function [Paraburkholderia dioscoreae]